MKKENYEIIYVKLRNSKNTETCILECYGYEHAKKTIENQIEVIKDDWHVVIDSPIVEQIVSELYYESDQLALIRNVFKIHLFYKFYKSNHRTVNWNHITILCSISNSILTINYFWRIHNQTIFITSKI